MLNTKEHILNFIDNIIVGSFPNLTDFEEDGIYKDINTVINVTDEFYLGNSELYKYGKSYFYFPLNEMSTDMGITSIYGALQVLYNIYTYNPEQKILLHCTAGRNRSPMIKAAFYYMMLNEHMPIKDNRLLLNIQRNHLYDLETIEVFLKECKYAFDNSDKYFGGMLDSILRQSKINLRK